MAPKNSRLENEERGKIAKVILFGELTSESFVDDKSFEVHRCEDVTEITRFWEGAEITVLLIDLDGLSEDDKSNLRKQMAQFSNVLVFAIAAALEDKAAENLLRMGCVGAMRRREMRETLARAVKAVIAGELWFSRTTISRVLKGFLMAQDPNRLTSREMEILGLMGGDLNNQQIADKLFISRETVRWHIKSLHAKLGLPSRRSLRDHVRLLHRLGKAMPSQREAGKNPESEPTSWIVA